MKNPIVAAILNFFLMGAGTLYIGKRKALGIGMTIAAGALTWVELSLQNTMPTQHHVMFVAVFLANTVLAIDGYREAKELNGLVLPARPVVRRTQLAR